MSKKDWAELGKGEINVVLQGCNVIAAVWCGSDEREGEEAANAALIVEAVKGHDRLRAELVEATRLLNKLLADVDMVAKGARQSSKNENAAFIDYRALMQMVGQADAIRAFLSRQEKPNE